MRPSREEFGAYIKTLDPSSAGGMSGLTYLMVKLWPTEILDHAYKCLDQTWVSKGTFPDWGDRWLAPIPKKVTDPGLKDLRPLMLVEVTRKIWVGLIMHKIRHFWKKWNIINENQHAYIQGKGTQTAIPQLIDAMESAEESKSSIFISSWDMSKAFDSLGRELVILCMERLHVPRDIASYLTRLDTEGLVYVRSPLNLEKMRTSGKAGLKPSDGFRTGKGVGQGDIPSPLLWVAAFDTLLCALADENEFKVQDLDGETHGCVDSAYADDLISMAATAAALQAKADIVSAWCLYTGLKISHGKLRTFGIKRGADQSPSPTLVIRGHDWTGTDVPICDNGVMTHLGVIWNMKSENTKQFESLKSKMEDLGGRIARYRGRTRDKITALHYCLRSTLTYRLQFSNWGLDKYEELDGIYSRLVKTITKNRVTYPTIPINCHVDDGGLGIESLSCFAQRCKLRILMKNVDKRDHSGIAMQGLVSRSLRLAGQGGLQRPNTHIGLPISGSSWLTSLIEWLARLNIKIKINGMMYPGNGSQIMANTASSAAIYDNFNRGVVLNGEDGDRDDPFDPIPLRIGQCWELDNVVHEILGFNENHAEVLRWVPTSVPLKVGTTISVPKTHAYHDYPTGLGSRVRINLSSLMKSDTLVERSPDTHGGLSCTLRSKVMALRSRTPSSAPRSYPPMAAPGCGIWKGQPPSAIYTDGSWRRKHTLGSLLLNTGEVIKGGAVILHIGSSFVPIFVEVDIQVTSAYEIEMACLLVAHELARGLNITIWSDCSSAISTLTGKSFGFHSQVLSGWKKEDNIIFGKVKAHPEKRLPRSRWSSEETGNWFADQVAGGLVAGCMTVKASDWLKRVSSFSTISLVSSDDTPYIGDLAKLWSSVNIKAYRLFRDNHRNRRGADDIWEGSNFSLSHDMMGRNKSIEDRAIVQREAIGQRWEWHWANEDNWCRACGSRIIGFDHPLRECDHPRMSEARLEWAKAVERSIWTSPPRIRSPLFDLFSAVTKRYGGPYAAVGNFLPDFVSNLRYHDHELIDTDIPACMRVLRTIGRGARELLRIASSIKEEKTPIAPTLRQPTLTEFFTLTKSPNSKRRIDNKNRVVDTKGFKTVLLDHLFSPEPLGVSGARSWCLIVPLPSPARLTPPLHTFPSHQSDHPDRLRVVG